MHTEVRAMQWADIRKSYPDQWLVIEALAAHSTPDHLRQLDEIAVIKECHDGTDAFNSYRRLHQQFPDREFYFVHTGRAVLDIHEQRWLGIRRNYAAHTKG